jgi:hypothetical protein
MDYLRGFGRLFFNDKYPSSGGVPKPFHGYDGVGIKPKSQERLTGYKETKERQEEKAVSPNMSPSDSLNKILEEKQKNILDEKTKQFQDYYLNKSKNIFPNDYQKDLNGRLPTQNPIKTYLNRGSTTYLSGLPKLAYERQIDVDRKYVREGQYVYGAQ